MKAKEKEENPQVDIIEKLYDREAIQTINFNAVDGDTEFPVSHTLKPLSDERFFQLEEEIEEAIKRAKHPTIALFAPKFKLWKEIAESVSGYGDAEDWREQMFEEDAVKVVNLLLKTEILQDEKKAGKDEVLSFNRNTPIRLKAFQGDTIFVDLVIYFRRETQAEKDTWLSIKYGNAEPLASAEKISDSERLFKVAKKMVADSEGYKDNQIPAWHIVNAVRKFFEQREARLGK